MEDDIGLSSTQLQLIEKLKEKKLVSEDAINAAIFERSVTEESVGFILVRSGFLDQQDLVDTILEIDFSDLENEELILPHIPGELLVDTRTMIVAQTTKEIYFSTMSKNRIAKETLEDYFPGREVKFIDANPEKIERYLEKISTINDSEASSLERIVREAIVGDISDIHIIPKKESYTIFYRHLGVRQLVKEGDIEDYLTLSSRIKDRSRMDLAERRIPQDGSFNIEFNGRLVDLRIATIPTIDGEVIVIRILDPKNANKPLDDLGISDLSQWKKAISRANGLAIVCGPTGSGKTTTLNSTVKFLDRFGKAIYTVEDPVEYNIEYIAQVNINHMVGLDFSKALRAFMRADPDIILVGEIRDLETARIAINAAEKGNMVLGTLHASSIRGAMSRFRDLGVPSSELKHVLRSVLTQNLIRVTCKTCQGEDSKCKICRGSGYSQRTIISECSYFQTLNDVVRLIETEDVFWKPIIDDAMDLYKRGETDASEIERLFGAEGQLKIEGYESEILQKPVDDPNPLALNQLPSE